MIVFWIKQTVGKWKWQAPYVGPFEKEEAIRWAKGFNSAKNIEAGIAGARIRKLPGKDQYQIYIYQKIIE